MIPETQCKAYAFDDIIIDVARRVVQQRGWAQSVAPRVFDLLVYLIERRDRVVAKEELLQSLWRGAIVSDGVLTRAVLKAREAIADRQRKPAAIVTVQRVGYRFAAAVQMLDAAPAADRPLARAASALQRLVIMPLDDETGDPALDWAATGLPALLVQALSVDRRLALVEPAAAKQAVQSLASGLDADRQEQALLRVLNAGLLLRSRLRTAASGLVLDWRLRGQVERRGRLEGGGPTDLIRRLATLVERALFPDARLAVGFESGDALAIEAFGRALQASEREQWAVAARLLKVVLDIEPGSTTATLQYLRTLANLHDPAAIEVGCRLVESARSRGDGRLLAAAHEALGRVLFNLGQPGMAAKGQAHIDEALRLAEPYAGEEWVVRIHLGLAIGAQVSFDVDTARRHYQHARQLNQAHGSVIREATVLVNLAELEASDGEALVAWGVADEALVLGRTHALPAITLTALCVLVRQEAALGLFGKALRRFDEILALAAAQPPNETETVAWVRVIAGDLQNTMRGSAPLARAVAATVFAQGQLEPRTAALLEMAAGHQALAEGDAALAGERMAHAVAQMADAGFVVAEHEFLTWLLTALERSGDVDRLQAACERIAARADLASDVSLRCALGHARAALSYAAGDVAGALRELEGCALQTPSGRMRAIASIDAAWLCLDAGQGERARALLRHVGPWTREHPLGRLALERCLRPFAGDACIEPAPQARRLLMSSDVPPHLSVNEELIRT